jgi:hypothetical protein
LKYCVVIVPTWSQWCKRLIRNGSFFFPVTITYGKLVVWAPSVVWALFEREDISISGLVICGGLFYVDRLYVHWKPMWLLKQIFVSIWSNRNSHNNTGGNVKWNRNFGK